MWRKAVLNSLGINQNSIKILKQTIFYRNHWIVKQLDHFYAGDKKSYPSFPMPYSDLTKIAHAVNRIFSIKRYGSDLMFNAQNYPMILIRNYVGFLSRNHSKIDDRRENLKKYLEHEEKKKGPTLVENIIHNEYWSMQSKIKNLEKENNDLKKKMICKTHLTKIK